MRHRKTAMSVAFCYRAYRDTWLAIYILQSQQHKVWITWLPEPVRCGTFPTNPHIFHPLIYQPLRNLLLGFTILIINKFVFLWNSIKYYQISLPVDSIFLDHSMLINICLFFYLLIFFFIHLSIHHQPSIHKLADFQPATISFYPFIYLSILLPTHPLTHPPIHPSINPFIHSSIYPNTGYLYNC